MKDQCIRMNRHCRVKPERLRLLALGLDGPNGLGSYLAHLPKDVVGGNNTVFTPRSGANALNAIQQRRNDALSVETPSLNQPAQKAFAKPDSNGDLAALSSRPTSSGMPSTTSSQGTHRLTQSATDGAAAGLQIYKRSTREVLPLKTGLNVRMRTLVTQHEPSLHRRQPPTTGASSLIAELESSKLVLSVELENPFESTSSFNVNGIDINIDADTEEKEGGGGGKVVAKSLQSLNTALPIELSRGSQYNLLFYVGVEGGTASHRNNSESDIKSARARNVTIIVSGRPAKAEGGGEGEEMMGDFDSQWNCALDLTAVLADARKRDLIASSGSSRNGLQRLAQNAKGGVQVAGNAQYSATALRVAQAGGGSERLTYPTSNNAAGEDTRTPRPGHLGMGFPPPYGPVRRDTTPPPTTSNRKSTPMSRENSSEDSWQKPKQGLPIDFPRSPRPPRPFTASRRRDRLFDHGYRPLLPPSLRPTSTMEV